MALSDTIRTVLEQHPKLLTAAFVASTYSFGLLAEVGTNAANNGP